MYNYVTLPPEQIEYTEVASKDDLPVGERLFLEIDANNIVIINLAGHYFAVNDVCTHDDGPLGDGELDGYEIVCPRHGARFDIRSGKVTALPAVVDIPAYPVRISNGMIELGLPRQ